MGNRVSPEARRVPNEWDARQLATQRGRLAVVTGANSGVGFEAALELARHGADVVLACRSEERGRAAEERIRQQLQGEEGAGSVRFMRLDVSSLASVRDFAREFRDAHERLDLLVNNAGVMAGPFARSVDGFEMQFATNHLGHFLLTAQLLDVMKRTPGESRVVNVSSLVHRHAWRFNEDEVMAPNEKRYNNYLVYADTKLCNVLFTLELDRRLKAAGVQGVTAVACHPGSTATSLVANSAEYNKSGGARLWTWAFRLANWVPIYQTEQMGVLPTLYAAAGPNVQGGDFYGPKGFMSAWGYPTLEIPSKKSRSETAAAKLWEYSERLAGEKFEV